MASYPADISWHPNVMKKQNGQISWTDVLYVPATLGLSYVLSRWVSTPLAVALSAVLALLVFSLLEPSKGRLNWSILLILLIGLIIYALQAFVSCHLETNPNADFQRSCRDAIATVLRRDKRPSNSRPEVHQLRQRRQQQRRSHVPPLESLALALRST